MSKFLQRFSTLRGRKRLSLTANGPEQANGKPPTGDATEPPAPPERDGRPPSSEATRASPPPQPAPLDTAAPPLPNAPSPRSPRGKGGFGTAPARTQTPEPLSASGAHEEATREQIEADRRRMGAGDGPRSVDRVHKLVRAGEARRQRAAGDKSGSGASAYAHGYVRADSVPADVRKQNPRLKKRLVVLCDGTWQDGTQSSVETVTNVLRLARCILPEDESTYPPIPQIVYYQSGVGTTGASLVNLSQGATGAGIVAKIREAYTFIAQNWLPGDEIFLFGFSRGAYTARTIAALIGDLGVLPREAMESFYAIFKAYQNRGSEVEGVRREAEALLDPLKGALRRGQDGDEGEWGVRCVGVWDTVGALGIPGVDWLKDANFKLLGFSDTLLGAHIAHAFHALALDEPRKDFAPTKWKQTADGRAKGQTLEQVWFGGAHSDVGGSYQGHDLADVTLCWMLSCLQEHKLLALDIPYFRAIPRPHAGWGQLKPHDPRTGFMALAETVHRELPTEDDPETLERYHPSAAHHPKVQAILGAHPGLEARLRPLEAELRAWWSAQPISHSLDQEGDGGVIHGLIDRVKDLWDGDAPDESAGGGVTKAEARRDARAVVAGWPATEDDALSDHLRDGYLTHAIEKINEYAGKG